MNYLKTLSEVCGYLLILFGAVRYLTGGNGFESMAMGWLILIHNAVRRDHD